MKLKKLNAILSLLSALTLLIHTGYNTFAYYTFYYNPLLKTLTALPFIITVCLHAICGMCAVFLQNDGTCAGLYMKQNPGTIIQRISASLIFPLLILHLNTFNILKNSAANGKHWLFVTVIILQILFFAVVTAHISVSFSRAFITLGLLDDINKKKAADRIICIACVVVFVIASVSVIRGELIMFMAK